MQTFLPYRSFAKTAQCLDVHRLNKQRTETLEILIIISGERPRWMSDQWWKRCVNHQLHPAVRMWRGHACSLATYGIAMCDEWIDRGYKGGIQLRDRIVKATPYNFERDTPDWLRNTQVMRSHRSNLLRKKPEYYTQFRWNVPRNMDYVWPV